MPYPFVLLVRLVFALVVVAIMLLGALFALASLPFISVAALFDRVAGFVSDRSPAK